MLLDAHEQLLKRDEEIQATLAEVLPPGGPQITGAIAAKRSRRTDREVYLELVRQVREVVNEAVPEGSTVLVVSKGDDELLRLGAREGWHFPRAADGRYAGHHPADGAAAVAHLEELRARGGRYLFPSLRTRDRPMSDNTINAALRRLGYTSEEQTGHGFRSMASTLLNEQGFPPDVIELQLAHTERNKVRAAYNKAQRLAERRKMMQAWADYLDGLRTGAQVIPLRRQSR